MSYCIYAFLTARDIPSPEETKQYLLEGALFDERPKITIWRSDDGAFARMELCYAADRRAIVLRRITDSEADAALAEAIDVARTTGHPELASILESATIVLERNIERAELDEDAWFALHLWQAQVLKPVGGWLHAPGDGLFDADLRRRCAA